MGELTALPNIGKTLERELHEVGIDTAAQLRQAGAEQVWLRLLARDPSACLHRLYALEGAVQSIRKADLPDADKARIKAFYNEVKKGKSD
ncbi:TfoX/Sxy family protein [Intestinibacillus massiliensis]|uniref:TfoX/Sxy family protein n=1 Tax=Intestinibacillus massiliensis TaxID=1871029 RepID=UPI000B360127|nr:TfoX/Sxy family protein [Intestinibacillus massiliensis]